MLFRIRPMAHRRHRDGDPLGLNQPLRTQRIDIISRFATWLPVLQNGSVTRLALPVNASLIGRRPSERPPATYSVLELDIPIEIIPPRLVVEIRRE